MADILHFRAADRRGEPKSDQGEFVAIFGELTRQWAARRQHRTSRAGLVADVIDIRTGHAVSDLEAVLATLGRAMSELEVVLFRFGAAIAERERQQRATNDEPE
jgi:hypothetical protein